MLRPAILSDAPMIARVNVQAWAETYAGILPPDEIARRTYDIRLAQWTAQIGAGTTRIFTIPDLGFVQFGPQRDADWAAQGYSEELYSLYLLDAAKGQGQGRAMFEAGRGQSGFTALVLDANTRACRFYESTGASVLQSFENTLGETVVRDRIYGWSARV